MTTIVMLGPQRLRPTLRAHAQALGLAGPIAAITAGWLEAEAETAELDEALGSTSTPLELYARAERCFEEDPELFRAHRERQRRLERLQRLYRTRLDHAVDAYRELESLLPPSDSPRTEETQDDLLDQELAFALEAVRTLDSQHQSRVRAVNAEFVDQANPSSRTAVVRERDEIMERLADSSAVVIAGGHVAVLLTRLRLFDLERSLADKTILAISAGAMVLAPRIVLFHDSPPWGAGNAEVLDDGLDLPIARHVPGIQPFPHARQRLRLDDPTRVSLLVRRFAPCRCVGLDAGSWLRVESPGEGAMPGWKAGGVDLLRPSGEVEVIDPEEPAGAEVSHEVPSR